MAETIQTTTNREDIFADQLGGHYRWTPTPSEGNLLMVYDSVTLQAFECPTSLQLRHAQVQRI